MQGSKQDQKVVGSVARRQHLGYKRKPTQLKEQPPRAPARSRSKRLLHKQPALTLRQRKDTQMGEQFTVASFNFGFEQALMSATNTSKYCRDCARVCSKIVEEVDADI